VPNAEYFNFSSEADRLSWLRRCTFIDLGSGGDRRAQLPRMASALSQRIRIDQNPDIRWVELDVFALGQPMPPSEIYRMSASSLTKKCIELGLGLGPLGPLGDQGAEYAGRTDLVSRLMAMTIEGMSEWGTGPMYQYWRNETFIGAWRERFNWTIACFLECGLEWMLGTARKCGYPQPEWVESRLRTFFNSNDLNGLDSMTWWETESGRDAIDTILCLANWAVSWGVVRPHGRNKDYMPMLYEHGNGGRAMIYTLADALLQVVMPCPLLLDDYGRLYRVWLLQAKDDPWYEKLMHGEGVEWFLRSKAILFTDVQAKDAVVSTGSAGNGLPGWRLRESVTVYGPPQEYQNDSNEDE